MLLYIFTLHQNTDGFLEEHLQVHNLTGSTIRWVAEGAEVIGRYKLSEKFTNAKYAFGKFKDQHGNMAYPFTHVRRLSFENAICSMKSMNDGLIWFEMQIMLPTAMIFSTVDGFQKNTSITKQMGRFICL